MDQGPLKWTQIDGGAGGRGGMCLYKRNISDTFFFVPVHVPASSETRQDQEKGMIGPASLLLS